MKIAHSIIITPHRAGIYETARDIAEAELKLGHDARMIDPKNKLKGHDRGVSICNMDFVKRADVIVNHSGLSAEMNRLNKPIIHILHGRPYSSFLLEQKGTIAVYSFWRKIGGDPRYKAFVTLWPEFEDYFKNVLPPEKVRSVSPPVDLNRWTPEGATGYQFHGHRAKRNVVVTDLWREDKTPYHVINAFLVFARSRNDVKLHLYAVPQKGTAWGVLKTLLREADVLGECVGFVTGLDNVYRAADVLITPHRMATRSVREAMACGCKVVMAPSGNEYTPFVAEPEDLSGYATAIARALGDDQQPRAIAEQHFDSAMCARHLIEIIKESI